MVMVCTVIARLPGYKGTCPEITYSHAHTHKHGSTHPDTLAHTPRLGPYRPYRTVQWAAQPA